MSAPAMIRVGVDVGGTFTDLAALDERGERRAVLKVPSTPDDPSRAIERALAELLTREALAPSAIGYLGHGTTVCVNAVLEGKGARTGLVTTRGMRDLLELRRQTRDHLYDLQADKPLPLVPRRLRLEVPERMLFDGSVHEPLDERAAAGAIETLAAEGVEAIAIAFLHAYANPAHERAVKALAARRPHLYVSASSDVLAEFREYERLSTTVLNAYVGPVMNRYLAELEERVKRLALPVRPHILLSNGGVATLAHARERPVFTMASGPSAGVTGAVFVARRAGIADIVGFDMGGTSTDVCLVERGVPAVATEKRYHGHPVKGAMLDVHSIGAGGGSIAWVDPGGFVRVGPASAGADPGPACYGRGGVEPTVSDANLVLGRLGASARLAGTVTLDPRRAETAIGDRVARRLGRPVAETAATIVAVVDAAMAGAVRLAAVARGADPRAFTLVAYGGAGPMHAGAVARQLGIRRVLVPPDPGVLCALGLIVSDLKTELSRTRLARLDRLSATALDAAFRELEDDARRWAERAGFRAVDMRLARAVEMRHARQNHELAVAAPRRLGRDGLRRLERDFHAAHRRAFGYAAPAEPVETVTLRVTATIPVEAPSLPALTRSGGTLPDARTATRRVWFARTGFVACPIYARTKLPRGARLRGPAVVEQLDATTVIEPGDLTHVDKYGNILITVNAR
ncbi:MAG: hydantoinase/oxoprolinase family protein [Candidatus Rokubacteria bacterium]|nr:hydantoinase/oxoprolinase family protein [Candidatus Rokubacteria bacterium]